MPWRDDKRGGMVYREKRRHPLIRSVAKLLAHLLAAAIIVTAFGVLEWAIQFAFDSLNAIHPFHADLLRIITLVELSLTYVDWAVCIVVILTGAFRFAGDVFRGDP